MLGRKLVDRLISDGLGERSINSFTLMDIIKPDNPTNFDGTIKAVAADISKAETARTLVKDRPDVIYHLAAIVSGEAEQDFARGNSINLDGTKHLLEAIRAQAETSDYSPRFVFSSSIAVFGPPLPDVIEDTQRLTPLSSYGAQKAMGELMVADYTRKGFVDGISLRLPTVTVRPGKPNRAASGFYSGIIREPLNGVEAVLPVPRDTRHWFQSPRLAISNLVHAGHVSLKTMTPDRALSLPAVSASVQEMMDALERIAGSDVLALIKEEPDEFIQNVVLGWPRAFNPKRAKALGFQQDVDFESIIQTYLEDDKVG